MEKKDLRKVDEIARLFDRTARRIQQLTQDGILPTVDGMYDLLPTVERYIQYLYAKIDAKRRPQDLLDAEQRKRDADARYKEAKAEIAELELDELNGKMHRSEDVEALTDELIWAIRGLVLAIPGRVAVDTAEASTAAETSEIVRKQCYEVLEELSRYEYHSEKYMERVRARTNMELDKAGGTDEGAGKKAKQNSKKSSNTRKTAGKSDSQ